MKEINCNIVRDILPLYVDDVVCDDTKIMIEEHLEHCDDCKKELKKLMQDVVLPVSPETQIQEAQPLKEFKKRIGRKQRIIAFISVLITVAVLVSGWYVLFIHGFPVESDSVAVSTEFQPGGNCYLNQLWAIHFYDKYGKSLSAREEPLYRQSSTGEKIECGRKIFLYKAPLDRSDTWGSPGYTTGISYDSNTAPEKDFDYTVEVIYKDKTYTYSMREEGLFTKQTLWESKIRDKN